jgi:hypothetical protein
MLLFSKVKNKNKSNKNNENIIFQTLETDMGKFEQTILEVVYGGATENQDIENDERLVLRKEFVRGCVHNLAISGKLDVMVIGDVIQSVRLTNEQSRVMNDARRAKESGVMRALEQFAEQESDMARRIAAATLEDRQVRQQIVDVMEKIFDPSSTENHARTVAEMQQDVLLMFPQVDISILSGPVVNLARSNRYATLFGGDSPQRRLLGNLDSNVGTAGSAYKSMDIHASIVARQPILALIDHRFLVNPFIYPKYMAYHEDGDLNPIYDLQNSRDVRDAGQWYGDLDTWPITGQAEAMFKYRRTYYERSAIAKVAAAYREVVDVTRHERKNYLIQILLNAGYTLDTHADDDVQVCYSQHGIATQIHPLIGSRSNETLLRIRTIMGEGVSRFDVDIQDNGDLGVEVLAERVHKIVLEFERRQLAVDADTAISGQQTDIDESETATMGM